MGAGPSNRFPARLERRHLGRNVRVHGPLDDLGISVKLIVREKAPTPPVGRVEHDRQAPLRIAAPGTRARARKGPGVWRPRTRPSGADQIERRQRPGQRLDTKTRIESQRMSVMPNCAMIDPSISSTIECTTDCGWITTSIWFAPTRQPVRLDDLQPLFINVAESIVILRPIRQVGW